MAQDYYSTVVVGTGFASTFFLSEYLKHSPKNDRVLVLERGEKIDHATRLETRRNSPIRFDDLVINRTPQKPWVQTIGFGGGTCWTGNTPRMHPNDFRTRSLYGIGEDWPLSYDELEPYYVDAEYAMGISGSSEGPYPRSRPYPAPPHNFNAFDELLAKKYPGLHIPLPSARSSSLSTGRAVCCTSGVCSICPIASKFQVDLHMAHVYADPRIKLLMGAEAQRVDIRASRARGVQFRHQGREKYVRTDLAVVGAHAIMTPFILLRSGLTDRALGRYLNEQISPDVQLNLKGINSFNGSQQVTGLGVMLLDGPSRASRPGCLIESWNVPWLRAIRGRWRQRALIKFVFEDIPDYDNRVSLSSADPDKPEIHYLRSDYMQKGLDSLKGMVEQLIVDLPVEGYRIYPPYNLGSSAHIQGTTRMGKDPRESVVDRDLRHHSVRNLLALGSGTFPTCPAANPTLTLSALSIRAARRLFH